MTDAATRKRSRMGHRKQHLNVGRPRIKTCNRATIMFIIISINQSINLYIKIRSVCPSVCATISASINPLPSDRLRFCDWYIPCQGSLAVKPLNSRPATDCDGPGCVGLWTLTRMCSIAQTDDTSHNRAKRDCDLVSQSRKARLWLVSFKVA